MVRRTQIGWTSLLILAAVLVIVGYAEAHAGAPSWVFGTIVWILLVCGLLCSSLTVQIDRDGVAWWFTLRLLARRLAYAEIASVQARSFLPLGYGLRTNLQGTTGYLVSGTRALEIVKKDGGRVLLSADDPEALVAAIRPHLSP
jgi:hypothetical protein